jgi:hypothetical protein
MGQFVSGEKDDIVGGAEAAVNGKLPARRPKRRQGRSVLLAVPGFALQLRSSQVGLRVRSEGKRTATDLISLKIPHGEPNSTNPENTIFEGSRD